VAEKSGFFGAGEVKTYRLGNVNLTFMNPAKAQGDYSIWVSNSPPGSGAGLHRHRYDEWHIIMEGRYECQVGDEVRNLGPGEAMFATAGTPHRIKNIGPGIGRQIGVSSPAGVFEAFVAEVVGSEADSGNPSRAGSPAFREIARKHGIDFI
jgi:mannose-6-phosphate isomerase-like protein (cupin superfamily)